MTKTERQDAEINKLLDRLQEAHEERDKYKKALEILEAKLIIKRKFIDRFNEESF